MVKYAVICASNQNRSMEAHNVLRKNGFDVSSYGTGTMVRLPGPAIDKPNIYPFGTPYDQVYQELKERDPVLYTKNGLLNMLDRNRNVKEAPQRWYDAKDIYDVIITCEERCFDAVIEDLSNRGQIYSTSTHVINVEIKDNHEDASSGGQAILDLAKMVEESKDVDTDISDILQRFTDTYPSFPILHTVTYF
ncbi:RNA polymerase II subunit A C-terminal domain phosphatase SSU72 [Halteromyces radiatus]|uniref:RNA polymerase II subunit A C-terminal domain phosphatase SSU72 n=1 Tax=Halteromyces radiatus TaxID=101107 RepID=UPI00221F92B0|nr:RNA polymerase II subunit A C-terminal domain phosphatase SSU72 [Halteromyces radiatus]KAI8093397.1 RNA polymerase II subunit A C-terminal domain phosphatase SSU72 [Halteromyces radiatus]